MVITAIDHYKASGRFSALVFLISEAYVCTCQANDKGQFFIEKMQCVSLNLHELLQSDASIYKKEFDYAYTVQKNGKVVYDNYYDEISAELVTYNKSIEKALSMLPDTNNKLYIGGYFIENPAVLYALQQKYDNTIIMKNHNNTNISKRFFFSDIILKEHFHLYRSNQNLLAYIANPLVAFIPLDEKSLTSACWGKKQWRDMLPSEDADCNVSGIPCKYVHVRLEIDGFNNIFFMATDAGGTTKYGLLHDAMNGLSQNSIQASKREVQSESVPIPSSTPIAAAKQVAIPNKKKECKNDVPKENVKEIRIYDHEIRNYRDIFDGYLDDVETVRIEDTYIYLPHQINNLIDFITVVNSAAQERQASKRLKAIHLITHRASIHAKNNGTNSKGKNISPDVLLSRQEDAFHKLRADLKRANIDFSYEFNDKLHDRLIYLSNGWTVKIGRGLDMFYPRKNKFQQKECRETTVTYLYNCKIGSAPKVIRNIYKP